MAVILAVKNIKSQCAIESTKAHKGVSGPEINGLSLTDYSVEKLGGIELQEKKIYQDCNLDTSVSRPLPDLKKEG